MENDIAVLKKRPNRLKIHNVLINSTLTSSNTKSNVNHDDEKKILNTEHNVNLVENQEKINEKRLNISSDANNIEPECDTDIENALSNDIIPSINDEELRKTVGFSLVGYNLNSVSMETQGSYWTRFNAQLGLTLFNTTDAIKWSNHEVVSYVKKVAKCYYANNRCISISDRFIDEGIDGETFLMLNQDDMMGTLDISFGQALRIFHAIIMLRQRIIEHNLFET